VRQLGDYEVLAELGRGGMGVVYLARQLSLGRLVALKMLPADLAGDEVALARLQREMRLLARCDHEQLWRELCGVPGQGDASSLGVSTWARAVLSASRKNREQMTPRPSPG